MGYEHGVRLEGVLEAARSSPPPRRPLRARSVRPAGGSRRPGRGRAIVSPSGRPVPSRPMDGVVLVLNQNYEPLNVGTCRGLPARVRREGRSDRVRPPGDSDAADGVRAPSVIRLQYQIRPPRPRSSVSSGDLRPRRHTCSTAAADPRPDPRSHRSPAPRRRPHLENLVRPARPATTARVADDRRGSLPSAPAPFDRERRLLAFAPYSPTSGTRLADLLFLVGLARRSARNRRTPRRRSGAGPGHGLLRTLDGRPRGVRRGWFARDTLLAESRRLGP